MSCRNSVLGTTSAVCAVGKNKCGAYHLKILTDAPLLFLRKIANGLCPHVFVFRLGLSYLEGKTCERHCTQRVGA